MSIFENFIDDGNGNIINSSWIGWDHFLVANKPAWIRMLMRNLLAFLGHCLICTSLDGCYFLETNMPEQPYHENCDCKKKKLNTSTVKLKAFAECDLKKFTDYLFTEKSKGKKELFESWGFSKNDSENLKNEYNNQALKEYLSGNYLLKNVDKNGQRLAIPITLKNVKFNSGWILEPEGKIRTTTPFGG